jgi:hypothetical protein
MLTRLTGFGGFGGLAGCGRDVTTRHGCTIIGEVLDMATSQCGCVGRVETLLIEGVSVGGRGLVLRMMLGCFVAQSCRTRHGCCSSDLAIFTGLLGAGA